MDNYSEKNIIIAEFMGILYGPTKVRYNYLDVTGGHIDNGMNFHKSWDWLIPVIPKCIECNYFNKFLEICPLHFLLEDGIETVFNCVVDFIEWYNKNG
jgi:hypothetical protein